MTTSARGFLARSRIGRQSQRWGRLSATENETMSTNTDDTNGESTDPKPTESDELPRVEYHLDETTARNAVDHIHSLGRGVASGRVEITETVYLIDALLGELGEHQPHFIIDGQPLDEWLEAEGIVRTTVEPRDGGEREE